MQILVVFSRNWDPEINLMRLRPAAEVLGSHYDFVPNATPEEARARVPFPVDQTFKRRGQWVDIYVNPDLPRIPHQPVRVAARANPARWTAGAVDTGSTEKFEQQNRLVIAIAERLPASWNSAIRSASSAREQQQRCADSRMQAPRYSAMNCISSAERPLTNRRALARNGVSAQATSAATRS